MGLVRPCRLLLGINTFTCPHNFCPQDGRSLSYEMARTTDRHAPPSSGWYRGIRGCLGHLLLHWGHPHAHLIAILWCVKGGLYMYMYMHTFAASCTLQFLHCTSSRYTLGCRPCSAWGLGIASLPLKATIRWHLALWGQRLKVYCMPSSSQWFCTLA